MMLGKYRLLAELGRGGMSKVYLAMARGPAGFNKLVVVKLIRPHLSEDPDFVTMFLDEARLAARLNHPNVVQTNEVGQEGSDYFIAMEYLEGQTLNRVISKLGPEIGVAMQLRVMSDALRGLHYAHELKDFDGTALGVVHRDISPHNILVTYRGEVKVVDFGIAKALDSSTHTRTGVIKGKVAYMSPEQAISGEVDRRADVFSAGVVLWQIAAGVRMFRGESDIVIIQRLMAGDIPRIRDAAPETDPGLVEIIDKALAPKKEDRYASAAELQRAIDAYTSTLADHRGPRDLGILLTDFFAEDQRRIDAVVERQSKLEESPLTDPDGASERFGTGSVRLPIIDVPNTESGPATNRSRTGPPSRIGTISSATPEGTAVATVHETHASAIGAGSRTRRLFAIAAALGMVLALVAVVVFRVGRGPASQSSSSQSAGAATYTLRIETTPPGATLREGDRILGSTPLSLTVEAGSPPRSFVAWMDGYQPKDFVTPAPTGDLLLQESLAPKRTDDTSTALVGSSTATATTTPGARHPGTGTGRPPTSTTPVVEPPPNDIRLKR